MYLSKSWERKRKCALFGRSHTQFFFLSFTSLPFPLSRANGHDSDGLSLSSRLSLAYRCAQRTGRVCERVRAREEERTSPAPLYVSRATLLRQWTPSGPLISAWLFHFIRGARVQWWLTVKLKEEAEGEGERKREETFVGSERVTSGGRRGKQSKSNESQRRGKSV